MKIYFTASIAQKPELGIFYKRIINFLEKKKYNVLAENILRLDVKTIEKIPDEQRIKWYKKALVNITNADLVVVEISFPSTVNVGHELSLALEKGKPVIALYKDDRDPIFLRGILDEKLIFYPYTENDLENILLDALKQATDQMDVRFNFFISPKIGAYLDWVSRNEKTPRAVYLRKLIEEDMEKSGYEPEKEDKLPKPEPKKTK